MNVVLRQRKLLAERDQDLCPDEIDPGDRFGHRMLDLHARIDLKKPNVPVVDVVKEFDGAETLVVQRTGDPERVFMQRATSRSGDRTRRCLLDYLLIAVLERAFALRQVNAVTKLIAEDLDFDMLGGAHEAFDEHRSVAERSLCFGRRDRPCSSQAGLVLDQFHAATAAAEGGLYQQRITYLPGQRDGLLQT